MAARPELRALADRAGILPAYRPMAGKPTRPTRDETREALLAAMGFDVSTESAARRALDALQRSEADRLTAPVRVAVAGSPRSGRVDLRLPAGAGTEVEWRLELRCESGENLAREGRVRKARGGRLRLSVPAVDSGYHELRIAVAWGGTERAAEQRFIACPPRCTGVDEALAGRQGFGWLANLYGLRSRRGWGVGDLEDLAELARIAGREGAAFLGVSPLHALWNRGRDVSPYSPVSRLHRNELYLDVEAIPELAESPEARARLADPSFQSLLARLRERTAVDYAAVRTAKRELLTSLHRTFAAGHRDAETARGRSYRAFLASEEPGLGDFATFVALAEQRGEPDWRRWPGACRNPRSEAVRRFREEHPEAVDLHRWIQFELDRQLAAAARAGRESGLAIGLYGDLAVGTAASGYDPWAFGDLFARGASVGAPPDDFSQTGQDWALPPVVPHRLVESAYAYWIGLLRAAFAHMGMLRLDHVMGLLRLWWVPTGRPPGEGAYVSYPARDLLGVLALESRRHGAVVVGEDLGTVPRGLAATLARWGVLSTRALYFERRGAGFRPAERYSRRALVTSSTHDLPPLAGFVAARDLELRRAAGEIPDDAALAAARRERTDVCRALARRLAPEQRDAAAGEGPLHPARLAPAVVRFLSRTPAPLVGFGLDDLVGETEPVNLPGIPQERFPSWTRRMSVALEDLAAQPKLRTALAAVPRTRRMGGGST
jgi:4-alpha-glucanotransferase